MEIIRGFPLLLFFFLLLEFHASNSHCTSGTCEKVSLSLDTNVKKNFSLVGYVFQKLNSLWNWKQCFNVCLKNCQCLSFNFNEVNTTENCELNDANTKLEPEALREKEGVNYYEPVRSYFDNKGVAQQTCSGSNCDNKCCTPTPCQNGGTCIEICDINERRYMCLCPPGFTGHKCQIPPRRSCKDILMMDKVNISGVYNISNQHNKSFPVFCGFGPEPGAAWTLIQSHSLNNNEAFKMKPFYLYDMPRNQNFPEWNNYRLSMSRMKSIQDVSTHWRATCNYLTDGVDYRDYIRVSLKRLDLLKEPTETSFCLLTEFVNVRGQECFNCTVLIGYSSERSIHMDSHFGPSGGCNFGGGIVDEDNFGYYFKRNPAFRCTSSLSSTTQHWLGSV